MILRIDKISAAGCQLDTAIELILSDKDVISTIVLVHSAWSVIKDLLINSEKESSRAWMPELFPNTPKEDVWKKIDDVWKFCKHANRDPHGLIEFSSDHIEIALFLALYDFSQISVKSKRMKVYEDWFIAKNEKVFFQYEAFSQATQIFPDLDKKSTNEQKRMGLNAISSIDDFYKKVPS